nr:hypothetical protein [Tanacetum cinerariifolium]
SIIPLRDIISQLTPSIVITTSNLVLPIEDLEDFLIMGNKDLNTIPEKELDEVIKSSVEDFVPIPSESEDTSGSDSECDLPSLSPRIHPGVIVSAFYLRVMISLPLMFLRKKL